MFSEAKCSKPLRGGAIKLISLIKLITLIKSNTLNKLIIEFQN
jgi:hypothetical protein